MEIFMQLLYRLVLVFMMFGFNVQAQAVAAPGTYCEVENPDAASVGPECTRRKQIYSDVLTIRDRTGCLRF